MLKAGEQITVAGSKHGDGSGSAMSITLIPGESSEDATTLRLMVTSNNDAAIRFYERLGFRRTGKTEPYPNDPTLFEFEMSRPVIDKNTSA